jgi:hypothetical protein
MCAITRRDLLSFFAGILPAAAVGCRAKVLRAEERMCVHVFPRSLGIPEPLLEDHGAIPLRRPPKAFFQSGLPELFVCASPIPLLQVFPFFWPILPEEFDRLRRSMRLLFRVKQLSGEEDIRAAEQWLIGYTPSAPGGAAAVFTHNDFTRFFSRRLVSTFRRFGIEEIVVFKDPTVSPYLCDFPALQKGFRRQPP